MIKKRGSGQIKRRGTGQAITTEMILTRGKGKTTTGTKRRNNRGKQGKAMFTEQRQLIAREGFITGKAAGREEQVFYIFKNRHSV